MLNTAKAKAILLTGLAIFKSIYFRNITQENTLYRFYCWYLFQRIKL